jgi:cytochrome c553
MAGDPGRALRLACGLALALDAGASVAAEADLGACLDCHGNGEPADAAPALGGQPELYLLYQLVFFRDGQRKSEPMSRLMSGAADADLRGTAAALAELPPPAPAANPDRESYGAGEEIAKARRCGTCHQPDFAGWQQVPRLAGQREDYLRKALGDYRQGARIGIQAAMAEVLTGLDAADLDALAHYLAHFRE